MYTYTNVSFWAWVRVVPKSVRDHYKYSASLFLSAFDVLFFHNFFYIIISSRVNFHFNRLCVQVFNYEDKIL